MCTCIYVVCTCVYVNVCALPLCVDCHIVTLSTISVKQLVRKGTISLDKVLRMGMYVCIIVYKLYNFCVHTRWVSAVCMHVSLFHGCAYVCVYGYLYTLFVHVCMCTLLPFMQNIILQPHLLSKREYQRPICTCILS